VDETAAGGKTQALIEDARALDRTGRRTEARGLYERALRALERPAPAMASMLMRWIARSYEMDADYAAAEDCAVAAVATAELSDDRNALGHALNVLAVVRWREGNTEEAEQLFTQALDRGTTTTDPRLYLDVTINLGSLAKIRGEFREALRHYQEALAFGRRHTLLESVVVALNNLGMVYLELGRLDAAGDAFTEALTIADGLGGLAMRIQLEVNHAMLEIARRDYAEARRRCDRGVALAAHLHDLRAEGEAEKVYGIIARETGDLVAAETHLQHAREMGALVRDLTVEGDANRELAELYARLGRNRETLQALNRAHACFTQLRARHELDDVGRRMSRLEGDFLDVVRRWGESIEAKDVHTQGHCERVADLGGALAAKAGLDENALFWFRIGALLHDVGKLIVPADVLNKPGKLTEVEWALVRQHPMAGVTMLADIEFPWDISPIVRSHHERWDGLGYPHGLAGEDIPLPARILCIADVYDALTTERSYKRAFSHLEAMEIMRREVGKQFDPQLFMRFEELVRRGTVSSPPAGPRPLPARRASTAGAVIVSEEDDLTGALVRRAFVNVTAAVLAERRRTGAAVSLLVMDVDHFKNVNDTFGHLAGDDALRLVAGIIREQLRPGQYVGRYAGDEFVVLLPGLDIVAAQALADHLRRIVLAAHIPLRERPSQYMAVTLSIGVSTAPRHGESFEALFTSADRALFEAKRAGRDKVVVAGSATESPPQLIFSRFVGRTTELRALVGALDESLRTIPQVRLVIGEAGVGKSSLARQLLPEVRLRGAALVTGRALESESRPPYGPWAEVLAGLHQLGLAPARPWPLLERLVPALGPERTDAPPALNPSQGRLLLQELVTYVRAVSEARPLAIVLEDMHWADAASWDALEYLMSQLQGERVFIALTLRSEEAAYGIVRERRQRLSRDERVRELRLERLTSTEIREWLQGTLHRSDLGDDLLDFVLRHTEGNPFLVMQLLRTMLEEGVFMHNGSAWTWAIPATLALPAGMSDLVGRRLSRLPATALRVLVTAAAMGRTFNIPLLAEAAGVSLEAVLDAIDSALASSVVEPAHDQDDDHYQFAHALLVDAVLNSVSPARQRVTHQRIADLLAVRTPQAVDQIASHYARSGNAAQAYTWCRSAAARAISLYALDEATDLLKVALVHAKTDHERVAASDELARAAELMGRWAEVERWCQAMLAVPLLAADPARTLPVRQRRLQARVRLGQSARETESECRALLELAERIGTPSDVVHTRSLLAQTLVRTGEIDAAVLIAEESLRIAEESGDSALIVEALYRLANTLPRARAREALELLRRLMARARSRGDRAMEARALLSFGIARSRTGDDAGSAEAFRAALTMARDARALDIAANASLNLGIMEMRRGNLSVAYDACKEALLLYTTLRNNTSRLAALYNLANLERDRGDMTAAAALYTETASLAGQVGAEEIGIGARAGVGIAALRLRDRTSAQEALDAALALLGDRHDWWFQGREMLESLAIRLAVLEGDRAGARRRFFAALPELEAVEEYAAAWLVADSMAELPTDDPEVWATVERFARHQTVRENSPLAARFTSLRDLAERPTSSRMVTPPGSLSSIDTQK
jgi:diguanylate cyclase (GGDEF)-like protein/putative nucleotidyltransferase with HDIG domain